MSNTTYPLTTDPAETLRHSFEKDSAVTISVVNTEDKKVAWKIKCSDNTLFKIKNPTGILSPHSSTSTVLTVMRDVDKDDPPKNHRYVLYSIYTEKSIPREAWKEAMDAAGPKVGTRKVINIIFESAEPATAGGPGAEAPMTKEQEAPVEDTVTTE